MSSPGSEGKIALLRPAGLRGLGDGWGSSRKRQAGKSGGQRCLDDCRWSGQTGGTRSRRDFIVLNYATHTYAELHRRRLRWLLGSG